MRKYQINLDKAYFKLIKKEQVNRGRLFCLSFNTPFGWLTITSTSKGLNRVIFDRVCFKQSDSELLKSIKDDILSYLHRNLINFYHSASGIKYPLDVTFTPFQVIVFNELTKIPYGTTISYKELARFVHTSPRACGRILGSNPFPIIIPCHRVICTNGKLGDYSGGIEWKKNLLQLEISHQKL